MKDSSSKKIPKIEIFTDGSSRGNPGPGGCAAILKHESNIKEISQGFKYTTNNRMELMAVILALEALNCNPCDVIIHSDSKYVVDPITKGWLENWIKIDFKKKKNKDLWLRFDNASKNHNINLKWVKGHSGHIENERCDQLAVLASKKTKLKIDEGYI
ncbi:MAG: ribonuclease HI [Bacteroidetes bacterium]|nr:ribonuclease HI [Bacteroidota bacterium]